MNPRRAIINFATSSYHNGQTRLLKSLDRVGYADGVMLTRDYPSHDWPRHEDDPYAFKVYAIDAAISAGYTSIIWIDALAWAVRHPGGLFDIIERDGHYFMHGGAFMDCRCTDACLARSGLTRDEAASVHMLGGSIYGFDLRSDRTRAFIDEWRAWQRAGLFKGPAINEANPEPLQRAGYGGRPMGFVSTDPRVVGHSHDEACASFISHRLGMPSTPVGREYGGYSQEFAALPTTYFVSQGM